MKQKKLIILLVSLLCVALCAVLLLKACNQGGSQPPAETTAPVTEPEATDAPTEPTQPEDTEPEATEPEVTEPTEPTEPEVTEPTGSSGGQAGNSNGTGGGYNPGTSTPTEPEDSTEGEITVPPAGSESNPYYEHVQEGHGSFETVKIPAGQTVAYRIRTPGAWLSVADENAAVTYEGNVYPAQEGIARIQLPADDSGALSVLFTNNGAEEMAFAVEIADVLGSETNPMPLESLKDVAVTLEEASSIYYSWTADKDGKLKLNVDAQVTATVNGREADTVSAGDEVIIRVSAEEAVDTVLNGYVAEILALEVTEIPSQVESVTIPAGESVYYSITGANGRVLQVTGADVIYQDVPAENGQVLLARGSEAALVELVNSGETDTAATLAFSYAPGHELNPLVLETLGDISVATVTGESGFYLTHTAKELGLALFQLGMPPEMPEVQVRIRVTNTTTGQSAAIGDVDENGDPAGDGTAAVQVKPEDVLLIQVSVEDSQSQTVAAALGIYGEIYGTEEMPIPVQHPGFTAQVPAGKTLYYAGSNLAGMYLTLTGENVELFHNGTVYRPENGVLDLTVVAEDRTPAVFAITNTANAEQSFAAAFTYPVGWLENPAKLLLGENVLTQTAGAGDYYYSFQAPRDGKLTLTFDENAQWVYTVDNMTQFVYGDTQYSDSASQVSQSVLTVAKDDEILIRVNTYDTANTAQNPAGEVVFTAAYVSGPTRLSSLGDNALELLDGEQTVLNGYFYDHVLTLSDAQGLTVGFNGENYTADSNGEIKVTFPSANGITTRPLLQITVTNISGGDISKTMVFSTTSMGSKDNPDSLAYGPNSFTQKVKDGSAYYYTFTATARGRFKVTFDADANWMFQLTNLNTGSSSGERNSSYSSNTYTITVRAGDVLELWVNTYDPRTGGSPIGTVEFTVDPA